MNEVFLLPTVAFFPQILIPIKAASDAAKGLGERFWLSHHDDLFAENYKQQLVAGLDAESFACLAWDNHLVFRRKSSFSHALHCNTK
jgi:hypothetical protein